MCVEGVLATWLLVYASPSVSERFPFAPQGHAGCAHMYTHLASSPSVLVNTHAWEELAGLRPSMGLA